MRNPDMSSAFLSHTVWFVYVRGWKQVCACLLDVWHLLAPLILRENNSIVSFPIKYSIPVRLICWY